MSVEPTKVGHTSVHGSVGSNLFKFIIQFNQNFIGKVYVILLTDVLNLNQPDHK